MNLCFLFVLAEKLKLSSTTSTSGSKVITLVLGEVAVPSKSGQQFPSMHESYNLDVDPSKDAITIMGKTSVLVSEKRNHKELV